MHDEIAERRLNPALPIYDQVRRDIEYQIKIGLLKPGDQLPSEANFKKIYGISRTPIRKALDILEMDGLIYRAQGRGSFVRKQKIGGALGEMIGFGQVLRDAGHKLDAYTISVELVASDDETSEKLDLEVGDNLIYIRRLFKVDGSPLVLFNHYLRSIIPIERLMSESHFPSLFDLLHREGLEPWEAMQAISATLLSKEEASYLQVGLPTAALLMKQTYYSTTGIPIWFSRFLVRADRYEYYVHLRKRT